LNDIGALTTFFGWCVLINIGFMLALILRGQVIRNVAARFFNVTTDEIKSAYLNVFKQYRNGTLLLSVAPYVVLKITTWGV
jgi:hypothetical protein|tara:strand:+ start:1792 stop:2034 length:243 start_codon:yes stop_codon:yes gene_type:complete